MRARLRLTPVLVLLLLWGCMPSPSTSPSVQPSVSPSEATEVSNLPPGCEPHNLRSQTGERIQLDGTWIEDVDADELPLTWWIRTQGDCVWAAGTVDDVGGAGEGDTGTVQTIRGRLGTDFVIDGEILKLGPFSSFDAARPIYSPIRLLVTFEDDGQIVLREDRVYGEQGPRCGDPVIFCTPLLVLRPAD